VADVPKEMGNLLVWELSLQNEVGLGEQVMDD
jgi:hypothetical protein